MTEEVRKLTSVTRIIAEADRFKICMEKNIQHQLGHSV